MGLGRACKPARAPNRRSPSLKIPEDSSVGLASFGALTTVWKDDYPEILVLVLPRRASGEPQRARSTVSSKRSSRWRTVIG